MILNRIGLSILVLVFISSCGDAPMEQMAPGAENEQASTNDPESEQIAGRWYSNDQVVLGTEVFAENCAECHGASAEGIVEDWRQRLDDGSFPPPPLNGSAHAWHHPTSMLLQVINNGGEVYGGKMPPFADILEDSEKLAAIAFFQSFWSDEIYAQWEQMGGTN
ncbi:MAG: cytochrome c [Gammaproteobacteria bacterium]|nr:cytochrome c [Gammaproteobacteria bacterium]MDD9957683.1 cytochrome c [Gammaproteobacteria bacterium]